MIIRKQFMVNNAHIVRNCYSSRCKYSLHAHTGVIEVFLEGKKVDRAGMLMDFGITKKIFKPFIELHQDAVLIWKKDSEDYKKFIKSKTDNWIELTFTPSAELLSAYYQFHFMSFIDRLELGNDEDENLKILKTRYHETRTGWAESTSNDVISILMDQHINLIIEKLGPIPNDKLHAFESDTGIELFGDSVIKVESPEIQVN